MFGFFNGDHAFLISLVGRRGKSGWLERGKAFSNGSRLALLSQDMSNARFTYVSGPDDFLADRVARKIWRDMSAEVDDDFSKDVISGHATDVTLQEVDEAGSRVVLAAKAKEMRGRGGAQATIESRLSGNGDRKAHV